MLLVSLERLLWIAIAPACSKFFCNLRNALSRPNLNESLAERTKQLNHFVKIVVRLNTGVNLDFWNSCALFQNCMKHPP